MNITKTKSGSWTVRVYMTDAGGHRHSRRFTGKNKDDVRNAANDWLNEATVYMESTAFCDASRRFLDHAEKVLSPNTVRGYKIADRMLQRGFPQLYHRPVDRITRQDIQFAIDSMAAAGKRPKTIENRIGYVSTVMSHEGRKIPPHTFPKGERFEPNVPTENLIRIVAAKAAGTRYEIPLALAVFGLRCGEVCAVRAEDISSDNILHVHRALATDDDGFISEKEPKEDASDRYIVIPASLADAIRKKGRATSMSPKAWSDAFPDLLKRAGIPEEQRFRLHDCRHFFVSYCHDVLKLSDAQIIRLSGHRTDHVMKRVYRHAITDNMHTVSASLGAIAVQ